VRGLEGELKDTLVKLGLDISDRQRLELGYEAYQDRGDYSYRPDMGLATDLAITNSLGIPLLWATELNRDTFTLNYDLLLNEHTVKLAVFSTESALDRDESGWAQNARFVSSAGIIEGSAENKGVNLLVESEMGQHVFTYGLDIIDYDTSYLANYLNGTRESSAEGAKKTALYLQDKITLSNRFAVIPGVRYSSFDIDSAVVNDSFSDTSLSLAGEFELTENSVVKLSSTQLFQGPEVGEVFTGAGLFDSVNQTIEAEDGLNTELSFAFEDQILGADKFSFGATFFKTQIDNYIYDYATPPPSVQARTWKDNVGNLELDGLEAYVSFEKAGFSALLTYSNTDSELEAFAEYAELDGARLDRTQGDTVSFNLDYRLEKYNLELHWDVLSVGSVGQGLDLDGASANNAKDSFTVHNLSARWMPSSLEGVEFTFGVDNVFDEYYASHSSRTGLSRHPLFGELYLLDYEPGRNLKATLAYQF
jgi:hemoglobin/transferrin/lactoferrin receptor protein